MNASNPQTFKLGEPGQKPVLVAMRGEEIMLSGISHKPRMVGTALFAVLAFSLSLLVAFGRLSESVHAHGLAVHHAQQGSAGDAHGFTGGWLNGQTVQFFYTRDFF